MVKSPAAVPVKSALVEVDGKDSQIFEEKNKQESGNLKKTSKNEYIMFYSILVFPK